MDQKEIVWIFGTSASGKETFIEYLIRNPDPRFVKELGWANKRIAVCQESIEYIGQFYGDPIIENRSQILDSAVSLLKVDDVILIKWQEVDTKQNLPNKLMDKLPNTKHRAFVLEVDDDELKRRLRTKKWWNERWDIDKWIEDERMEVKIALDQLNENFKTTFIDATTSDYRLK